MLKVGDTIKCLNANEMVDYMTELAKNGVYTDFLYEKDGEKGYWLVIEKIDEVLNDN